MSKSLREEIRAVLALSVAAALLSPAAFAQENEDTAAQQTAQEPDETVADTEFSEIVVTGSRIRRTEYSSPAPVTVITAERSQLAGLLSTEDILQNTTAASGEQVNDAFSAFITDGGPGANTISLRGLGANRTLVLVNGKRWAPSGVQGLTNSVDLSAIPSSIVSRIEILKDGASSIYGADAVAGVVNVITKESFDGLQLNGTGMATHDGGGEAYSFDATWGMVGDRGSFSISARYDEQKEMVRGDRDWARCDTFQRWTDQAFPAPPDGTPVGNGVLDNRDPVTGEPLCFGTIYGLAAHPLDFYRYEPSLTDPSDTTNPYYDPTIDILGTFFAGAPIPFFTRVPVNGFGPTSWDMEFPFNDPSHPLVPVYDNEGAYYNDFRDAEIAQLQSPTKLVSLTSFGQRDFEIGAGTTTAYYEAYWNRRETESRYGYRQFFPLVLPYTDDFQAYHPYNPFARLGDVDFVLGLVQPVIMSWNIQDPTTYVDIDRYNVFGGLKGDLTAEWDYEFTLGYGRSEGTYKSEQWLNDRVEAAVNRIVVRPSGEVTCSDAALAEFPDCVPLNLFTEDAMLRGILPADAVAFISKMTKGRTVYEGKTISAYATGPLFSVPAGSVKAVIGGEYREESIDDVPDEEAQDSNFWGFSTAGITKGTNEITEFFGEVEVPLLSGKRFAEDLYISGSLRYTDVSSYGDDTTYRAALNYQVTEQFLLRSTYGTSFRPPDLYEQFLGDFTGFSSNLNDPCNQYGSQYQPGDPIYDNCAAQGLPGNYFATSSIETITAGASDLEAETSDSLTIGFVITPSDTDFSIAVDYFDIQIENTIQQPGVGGILFQCYGSVGLSDPLCDRVGPRDPDLQNQISFVDTSYLNIGKQQSRGYDLNLLYEHQFSLGKLTLDGIVTYLDKQNYELFGDFVRLEGRWGFPRLSANTQVRYDWRDWQFGWFMEFIGESEEAPVYDPGTTNQDRQNRTPNMLYHTLSTRYTRSNWEAIATVRNVFNKEPPYVANGQGNQGASRFYNTLPGVGYDLYGRSYILQLGYKF